MTAEKLELLGKLQAATSRNADVTLLLDKLRPVLDLSDVDLVKADLFDQALSPLDEKVIGRILKLVVSVKFRGILIPWLPCIKLNGLGWQEDSGSGE